jgi:nucleoside-diphosphate kinase
MALQQTLVLVKPDGVARGLTGEVIKRIEKIGLKIIGLKLVKIDSDFSKKHYAAHIDKGFYKGLEKFILSGPVVAMVIEGVDAIENIRKLAGATESKSALPGTIRGDFSHVSYSHADERGIAVKNIIHASGDVEDAEKEVALWFSIDELHSYKRAGESHLFE